MAKKNRLKHADPKIEIGVGVLFDYAEGHGSKEFQEKLKQAGIDYEFVAVDGLKTRDYRVYHEVLPWFFIQGEDGRLQALGGHGAILTFIRPVD